MQTRDAAVFLDKDGTLVRDVPYNVDPAQVALSPGAAAGLRRFARLGYRLFVISNQPGLALGRFGEDALQAAWRQLERLVRAEGVQLAGFYYCPHHPDGSVAALSHACECRKPAPGLLLRAAREHGIALQDSWMVGDILNDVEAGRRAGCRTILIDNGNETEWLRGELRTPDLVAPDLRVAASLVGPAGTPPRTGPP